MFTIEAGQLVAGYYRLVEYVGAGAMGVVWRAVDERLERSVAVKKVIAQHGLSPADKEELHQRAMREAKNAARLQHPNAIMVFDITEHEGDPCLVMEYLPSHSLSELLAKRGALPVAEVARIGEQVGSALVAAHQAGMVHRDVKPGNILISDAGIVKLTDFGISRAQGDMTLTATGLVGGTPAYLAPELARGADPTPASDVFALGATLYHAIEGHSPYGDNPNQLALLHTAASGKIQPPRTAGSATALLMSMLRPEPAERPSMRQAAQRLAAVASGAGAPAAPPATLPAMPPQAKAPSGTKYAPNAALGAPPRPPKARTPGERKPRGGRFGLAAGVLGLIAVVALAAVLLLNRDEKTPPASAGGNDPTTSQQAEPPASEEKPDKQDGGPIGLSEAGNLIVKFYSFPEGANASWKMLSPKGKAVYKGDKQNFLNYWSRFDAVWSQDVTGVDNGDGSVTMTATVVKQIKGKERSQERDFQVIRKDGELLIDSGTR